MFYKIKFSIYFLLTIDKNFYKVEIRIKRKHKYQRTSKKLRILLNLAVFRLSIKLNLFILDS